MAVGYNASAVANSTALGAGARTTAANAIAIGSRDIGVSLASGDGAITLGNSTTATGQTSIAIGRQTTSTADGAVAVGQSAQASGVGSVALGGSIGGFDGTGGAVASGRISVAIGPNASAVGSSSVAIGSDASSLASGGTAVGPGARAANNSFAGAYLASAEGQFAVALGTRSQANAVDALAFGRQAEAGTSAIAIGFAASAMEEDAIAIGRTATVDHAGGIALGAGSMANAPTGIGYGTGTAAPASAVSIGSETAQRRIQNLSAGSAATDAVNVSQLDAMGQNIVDSLGGGAQIDAATGAYTGPTYVIGQSDGTTLSVTNVGDAVTALDDRVNTPITFAGNSGSSDRLLGDTLIIQGAASRPGPYSGQNLSTTVDSAGIINLEMSDQPQFGDVIINAGGTGRIAGVAAGVAGTDAVNRDQLDAVADAANAGWNLTAQGANGSNVAPGDSVDLANTDGNIVVSKDAAGNDVTFDLADDIAVDSVTAGNTTINNDGLTIIGGPSVTAGGIDAGGAPITNVAAGTAPTDAANLGQVNDLVGGVANTPITFAGNSGSSDRLLGDTLTIQGAASRPGPYSGQNLSTTVDSAGIVNLEMSDQPQFGDVIINDGGTGRIAGVAAGVAGTDAVNRDQLDAVADAANAGWNLSAQGANGSNVAPGDSVDLANTDGNIVVSKDAAGNDVTFDLADDIAVDSVTAGNTTINNDGLTIIGGPSVTAGGIDAGNAPITNVADGTAPTDAANLGQVNDLVGGVANTPISFAGNSGSSDRLLGDTLTIQGAASRPGPYSGQNLSTTVDSAGIINLEMSDQPQFGDVIINDGGTGRIAGVAGGVAGTDAVNVSQLTTLGNSMADSFGGNTTYNPVTQTIIADLSVGGTSYTTIQDALDAIDASAMAGFSLTAQGANATNVGPNDSIDLANADGNIVVSKDAGSNDVSFDLADDIAVDTVTAGNSVLSNAGLTIADGTNTTTIGADGMTIASGPSVTSTGIDAGGSVIANVAAGVAATDAVNVSQLNLAEEQIDQNAEDITELDETINDVAGDTSDTYVTINGRGIRYARTNEEGLDEIDAYAQGVGSTALGHNAVAEAGDSVAIGRDSRSLIDTGVALGSGAVSDRAIVGEQGELAGGLVTFNTTDATLLGAVSLGNSEDGTLRQITNMADGTQQQDAVTLRQLANSIGAVSATSTMYFHANPGEDPLDPDADSVAGGLRSIAVGPNTVVNADNGIGIGNGAIVNQNAPGGIAIGHLAQIQGAEAMAFGSNAVANAGEAIAIGAGASATQVASLALGSNATTERGPQSGYSAYGLDDPQSSVGEVSFGRAGQERQLTNVAAGSADTDAVNVSQLRAVDEGLEDLADRAVTYDGAPGDPRDTITLAGADGTTITNLADGAINAGSSDAVNGSQIAALSQSIADNLGGDSTVNPDGTVSAPTYVIQGNTYNSVGGGFTAVDQSLTNINNQLNDISTGGGITYFRANSSLADASANGLNSVAIGPEAVANGENSFAAGNGAAAGGTGAVALGQGAQANNANDVALGAGSATTEAVGTSGTTILGSSYDFAGTTPVGTVSVGASGSERTITNLAAGRVSADSTDAINGSQLHATNVALEELATELGNVGGTAQNAVLYDTNADGSRANSITLQGGDPDAAVQISNVGRGVRETDAVNVAQLDEGLTDARTYTDTRVDFAIETSNAYTDRVAETTLNQANAYTDQRFDQLNQDIGGIRREARQAAAIGIAAASLRYDDRPGKASVALGGGLWQGEGAFAFGAGYTSENGRFRTNLSGTTAGGDWGVGAGLSFTLN
ncbi:YadA-like family protein [Aliihoeflea sp. PC F10.4]